MSHTILDLQSTNRNLEDEKSSLLTAISLIQSDYSQSDIKATVSDAKNEGLHTWKVLKQKIRRKPLPSHTGYTNALETSNQYAIFTETDTNTQQLPTPIKSHGSEQSQHHTNTSSTQHQSTLNQSQQQSANSTQVSDTQPQTPKQPHGSEQNPVYRREDPIQTQDGP